MLYEKIKVAILIILVLVTAILGFFEVRKIEHLEQQVQRMQHIEQQSVHYNTQLMKSLANKVIMQIK